MAPDGKLRGDWRSQAIYEPPLGPSDTGHVYVVGFAGYIKIGFSRKARERVVEIQDGVPEDLMLYALIPGTMETERDLHARFHLQRLRGEWFGRVGTLAAWVKAECPKSVHQESLKESQACLSHGKNRSSMRGEDVERA